MVMLTAPLTNREKVNKSITSSMDSLSIHHGLYQVDTNFTPLLNIIFNMGRLSDTSSDSEGEWVEVPDDPPSSKDQRVTCFFL